MARHPLLRVQLDSSNRRVDLIEEGVDVAIRVRNVIEDSANLVVRRLATTQTSLVASPALLAERPAPKSPADMAGWPALTMSRPDGRGQWALLDQAGHAYTIQIDSPG